MASDLSWLLRPNAVEVQVTKPITVHLDPTVPSSWELVLILEELQTPYRLEISSLRIANLKAPADRSSFPQAIAIKDPNTNTFLCDYGAIFEYLIDQYDTANRLSYPTIQGRYLCNQWVHFAARREYTPLGGQARCSQPQSERPVSRITNSHTGELEARSRSLENALDGKEWLVGDKMTFADLAFATWNEKADAVKGAKEMKQFENFPRLKAWHERVTSRPAWKVILEKRAKAVEKLSFQLDG